MSFPTSSISKHTIEKKLFNLFPKDENGDSVTYRLSNETKELIASNLDSMLECVLIAAAENASKDRRRLIHPSDVDFSRCWEVDMEKLQNLSGCFKLTLGK